MNILKKALYILFLTVAVTLTSSPAQTFASAAPYAKSPAEKGCDQPEYDYAAKCVLPPFRWGGGGERLVHDDSGLFGAVKSLPTAFGGLLYSVSGYIWQGLIWVVRFGLSAGADFWDILDAPVARVTAVFGTTLLPLSLSLVFFTMIMGAKKTFSKGNIFMNFIRQGSAWLLPFTLLAVLVNSSMAAHKLADDNAKYKVKEHVGTAAWLAVTVDTFTSKAAATLTGMNFNLPPPGSGDTPDIADIGCTEYINKISEKYIAANSAENTDTGDPTAATMVAVSNLWVNTHYANVMRGQFGTATGAYDLPELVGCHAYESWSNTPLAEQYSLTKEVYHKDMPIVRDAAIFGPHAGKPSDAKGMFVKAMTAWAACDYSTKSGSLVIRPPYEFVEAATTMCENHYIKTDLIGSGDEKDFYIFGDKAAERLRETMSISNTAITGPIVKIDREAMEVQIRPAEEMAGTMSGLGMSRFVYGLMSLLSAIVSLIVIGPMGVGLLVTVFASILLVTIGLPVALLLTAGGKTEQAKPIFKALASSMTAKAVFTVILTLVIAVIKLFNQLVLALEASVPSSLPGSESQLPSMVEALLYGLIPLLAFAIVNAMIRKIMPNVNLMNPVSTLTMAAQGLGKSNDPFRKIKYDKYGNEKKKKDNAWDKYRRDKPNSIINKGRKSIEDKQKRVDNVAPTWKNFKKFQPIKKLRGAEADQDYLKHKDAKDKAKKDRIDAKETTKVSREDLRAQVADLKDSKKSKKDAKEGLRAKQGEPLDPEALDKSKTLASSKPGISKNSAGDNRKDNKGTDDLATRKVQNDTGNPAEDREKALLDVARDKEGPILSKLERDAQLLVTMGTDDLKEAAMYGLVTTDGHVIDTRNALHDTSTLKDLTEDELWERVSNSAPGLGADLAPKINPKTGVPETEIEQAARIKTIMRARGLSDNDGNEVHAMEVLGVNKTQLAAYVESGSTGNKDLDNKLKNYENGNCAEFACVDNVYETKAIQIAQAVQEERVRLVEVLGLDGANSHITDRKADVVTKGKEFITLTAQSTLQASNLAATEPDMGKVAAGIKDIVEKQFSTLRGSVPDDAVYARLVERAMESTVIDVIHQATAFTAANGMNSAASHAELRKLVGLQTEQLVISHASPGNQQITIQHTPMDPSTIDSMVTQMGVTMEDSLRETAKWREMPPGEDRSKSARIVAIREQETANQINALASAFEAAMVAQNQEISKWGREAGYPPETIAAQQIAAGVAISKQTLELKEFAQAMDQAYLKGDIHMAQRYQIRVSEIMHSAEDKTKPSDAFSSPEYSAEYISGVDAFNKKAAEEKARRTSGIP